MLDSQQLMTLHCSHIFIHLQMTPGHLVPLKLITYYSQTPSLSHFLYTDIHFALQLLLYPWVPSDPLCQSEECKVMRNNADCVTSGKILRNQENINQLQQEESEHEELKKRERGKHVNELVLFGWESV